MKNLFLLFCVFAATTIQGASIEVRRVAQSDRAFSIAWTSESAFTNYVVHIWTNRVEAATEGQCIWRQGFNRVEATSISNPNEISNEELKAGLDSETPADQTDYACYKVFPAKDSGALRLGTGEISGWLRTPSLNVEGSDLMLKIRAKRYDGTGERLVPVDLISQGRTNQVAVFSMSEKFAEYTSRLDLLQKEDALLIHSATNVKSGRIVLDSIELWEGVKPPVVTPITNEVRSVGLSDCAIISNQLPTLVYVQVEGQNESGSVWSDVISINRQKVSLAFWRTSSFRSNRRSEDFGWVTNITHETDWRSGEMIPGFYAYKKDSKELALPTIYYDSRARQTAGLYASYTNKNDTVQWSISLQASGDYAAILELYILNDKQNVIKSITFAYDEYEWPNKNSVRKSLTNAYVVVANALTSPANWTDVAVTPALDGAVVSDMVTYGYTKRPVSVTIPVKIHPGEVFYYRWIAPEMSNAPMLGVGNLTVTLGWNPGFLIILR